MRSDATRRGRFRRPGRRGVTLIEMMVTVALLLLIMTIIVSVFRSATGAVRGAQVSQELDGNLRRVDAMLRQDLVGATARFTPPLDPKDNLGYFELGENSFADAQGEDTDDWIAWTVKAPPGQPFLGRYFAPATVNTNVFNTAAATPQMVTQNTNPLLQPTIISSQYAEVLYFLRNGNLYRRVLLIVPGLYGNLSSGTSFTPGAQSGMNLGGQAVGWFGVNDISARPSYPPAGFGNAVPNSLGDLTNRENRIFRPRFSPTYFSPSGSPDDFGGEGTAANPLPNGIPDFYTTLYPNVLSSGLVNEQAFTRNPNPDPSIANPNPDILAFPYIYPGSFSVADSDGNTANGAIHGWTTTSQVLNHSPMDLGDPLNALKPAQPQTYWGWPTWRETLSTNWNDPVWQPATNAGTQSTGLRLPPNTTPLPPMTSPLRLVPQPFNDGAGNATTAGFASPGPPASAFFFAWEDDLIMTGVRSFDVKVYDPNAAIAGFTPGYYDLGYNAGNASNPIWVGGFPAGTTIPQANQALLTFGHEGRMPPLTNDFRLDPQYPTLSNGSVFNNIGENSTTTLRLRRVWCSWSTDYTNAPALPTNPLLGPLVGNRPVYPSYPAPYPAPLRGIQIQIRVVNPPDNDRVKVLTIRQDFTDKL